MSLKDSLHVKESTKVLDSGFHAVDRFRIQGTGFRILCQWKLDSGFQSLVGLQIPQAKISQIPESAYPYKGRKDIRKEVATKSLLKPLFLHCMLTHHNISMDLNNKEKIDMTSSR